MAAGKSLILRAEKHNEQARAKACHQSRSEPANAYRKAGVSQSCASERRLCHAVDCHMLLECCLTLTELCFLAGKLSLLLLYLHFFCCKLLCMHAHVLVGLRLAYIRLRLQQKEISTVNV